MRRSPRILFLTLLAGLCLAPVWAAPGSEASISALDYSTTRLSEKGAYKVSFFPLADPIPLAKLHPWRLHVEDAKGKPLAIAAIEVDGGMPEHRHGLPTKPQVTQNLGKGDYLVEGLRFQMRGWWEVRFTIAAGGTSDTVTFNLKL